VLELRESAGYLDPYIRIGNVDYSLLREEGHGLRELVILLTAIYREDWNLLVIDEPELHLHPSMTRLWLSELERVCRDGNRRAIVVTHEPSLARPTTAADLEAVWLFAPARVSKPLSTHVQVGTEAVLVEGVHDIAALTVALARAHPPEVVAQTELIECGGSGGVALWFEIAHSAGLNVRAVGDLDACLASEVQRVMDANHTVVKRYRSDLAAEPPKTSTVLRPLIEAMNAAGIGSNPKDRASWLANDVPEETGWASRRDKLLDVWRDTGFWLHEQGTLEDVLGLEVKGKEPAQVAAQTVGDIDDVAGWCAYELDPLGDVETLLGAAVERIAHNIMEALRVSPSTEFSAPVGSAADSDARLVRVEPLGDGRHRLVVLKPDDFAGRWLEFSRETPSTDLILQPAPAASES
jgi:hypothetical protein